MLEGLLAPLRVVLQRSLADWLIVVATWLVIVCATTLLAIGVLYGDAVALSGLRQTLASESIAATSIDVQMRVEPDELDHVDEVVTRQSRRILGWTDGELARTIRSGTYGLEDAITDASETDLAIFAAADRLTEHASILEGRWPLSGASPLEVALSSGAAGAIGLEIGDELSLTSRAGEDRVVELVIVGIWEPNDPDERYWLSDTLELTGVSEGASFTLHGPLVVTGDDLVGRVATGDLDVSWRTLPEFDNLALENVAWMRNDTAALERRIRQELGDRAFFSVATDLPQVLRGVDRSLLVSRSGVLLLTIQFAILAAYALVLVAGLLVEQRRIETALLRSRGASAGHVAWMALLEGLLLVVPAAIAAPWIALGVLRLFDAVGPLAAAGVNIEPRVDSVALIVAAVAGLACLIGLVVPAFASGRGLAAVRQTMARQGNRTLAQRLGIDLALVVLAGIGLWQLRQYGAPLTATVRGSIGLDPLLVAAPAIGLLAGAILALRIVPLMAELAERALGSRRGLVAPLGARQLSRRPLRYTRSALLLMLAAALGTFAATYTTTWTGSQEDQANYEVAADVRIQASSFPDMPLWALEAAYEAVEGVQQAVPVVREPFDVDGAVTGGQLLAVDADQIAEVIDLRPDLISGDLDDLVATIDAGSGPIEAIPIPGEPASLVVTIDSALMAAPPQLDDDGNILAGGVPIQPDTPLARVSVVARDPSGMVYIFVGGTRIDASAPDQEVLINLADELETGDLVQPLYPLEIVELRIDVAPPEEALVIGELSVVNIRARDASGASAIPVVDNEGWAWERLSLFEPPTPVPTVAGDPGRMIFTGEPGPTSTVIYGAEGETTLRLGPAGLADAADEVIPILVSRSFAASTDSDVNDELAIGSISRRTRVVITGILDAFPTVDPASPFAVVDIEAFAMATYARGGGTLFADDWWLSVVGDQAATAAAALRGEPFSTDAVIAQRERQRDLLFDPVALGVIGALGIGSVAAIIVASIGFGASAVVSTRERLGEFALLRALGLSTRQLTAWLTLENAFLLGVGLVAGTGLGLLLAWLVLPFVTLTQDATVVVPPVLVEIPWFAIGAVYAIAGLALVVTVAVIGGVLRRVQVSGVLRGGEND